MANLRIWPIFRYFYSFTTPPPTSFSQTMGSRPVLDSQAIEILVLIFSQLNGMRDIDAVRQTWKYLNDVVFQNETTITRTMSKSTKFSIAVNQSPAYAYDSIMLIYPAKLYSSPTGNISYAWLRMLEQRMMRASLLSALIPPPGGHFSDVPSTGRWHSDVIHFLWRFLETPGLGDMELFLKTLDSRTIIRMADLLETAISCGLRASAYQSLPIPGTRVPTVLSFGKIMRDMRRRDLLGSTRNYKDRVVLARIKRMDRGHLLNLAEMFICGNSDIVNFPQPYHFSTQLNVIKKDRLFKAVKDRRLRELRQLNPTFLVSIDREMRYGDMCR